jgi:hypothetical protein
MLHAFQVCYINFDCKGVIGGICRKFDALIRTLLGSCEIDIGKGYRDGSLGGKGNCSVSSNTAS